jgi:hypothetical protein
MKPAPSFVVLALLFAGAAPAAPVPPRVSMQAARARALAIVPHGRLIYSFDIRVPGRPGIEEVQISAIDGRLVSRTHETPAAERREARAEAPGHR